MIDSFSGQHRFLSNFYAVLIQYDGTTYPSVEHAYQAAKTWDLSQRAAIQRAPRAAVAKAIGRRVPLRTDWDEVKVQIMGLLLRKKFEHPNLRAWLEATKPHELVEGNTWGDRFWGVCQGDGLNMLGKLLMEIRDVA